MIRVLILFAHPALEKSRVHRHLIRGVSNLPGVTFHDLYEAYPTFDINVPYEQALLTEHDLIVFQHPFFWYSTPALLKQWEDLVLEHGWAYGSRGTALRGKQLLSAITTGGNAAAYQHDGYNHFTLREFLTPIEQTARLCHMEYLPPFVVHGTHRMTEVDIERAVNEYRQVIEALRDERIDLDAARHYPILNENFDMLLKSEALA
jgi:glutathione-regulated potassium-efflux system ancillary protein KefG